MVHFLSAILLALSTISTLVQATPVEVQKRASVKAGMAWPNRVPQEKAEALKSGDLSWYFNWAPTPRNGPGEFVATIFEDQPHDRPVPDVPEGAVVLGFNEPDQCGPGQACMQDIGQAVDSWMRTMVPLAQRGHKICSPVEAGDNGWLGRFMQACRDRAGCPVPVCIRAHTYQTSVEAMAQYLTRVHDTYGLPIWVTELADHNFGSGGPPNIQHVHDFMGGATEWLDNTPWIERYAWFGAGQAQDLYGVNPLNRLQFDDGSLTPLGRQYVGGRHS